MKRWLVAGVSSSLSLALCGCPPQVPSVGHIYPGLAVDGVNVGQGLSIDEYENGDLFVLGKGVVLQRAEVPIGIRLRRTGEIDWATLVPLPPSIDLDKPDDQTLTTLAQFDLPDFPADLAPDQEAVLASIVPLDSGPTRVIRHVRLSEQGEIVVDESGLVNYPPTFCRATLATQDSGNVILGAATDTDGSGYSFLLKLDRTGNQEWLSNIKLVAPGFRERALAEHPDGSIFAVGLRTPTGDGNLLAKYSSDGNIIWSTEIGDAGAGVPSGSAIATTPEGGAAFFGLGLGGHPAVVQVGSQGDLFWVNAAAIDAGLDADDYQTMGIAVDAEGNTVVVGLGTTKGQILMFQTFTDVAFIAKFDPDGDMLWLRTLPTDHYLMNAITVLRDGTYATAGFAYDVNNYSGLNVILFDPETGDVIN